MAASQGKATSMGTDRLIENSGKVTDPDTALSSDYRGITPDGRIVALDYQTGKLDDPDNPFARLSIFKNVNWENDAQKRAFTGKMIETSRRLVKAGLPNDLDSILGSMRETGDIPKWINTGYLNPKGKPGTRAGKFLSDGQVMGQQNKNPQHRMEGIVYGLSDTQHRHSQYGMLPQELIYLNAANVRHQLGDHLAMGRVIGNMSGFYDNNLSWNVPLKSLEAPMDRNHVAQISQPYTFK